MKTTEKIISLKLTQEDLRQLEELKDLLKENQSQIIKRALNNYYFAHAAARQSLKEILSDKKRKENE